MVADRSPDDTMS